MLKESLHKPDSGVPTECQRRIINNATLAPNAQVDVQNREKENDSLLGTYNSHEATLEMPYDASS